MNATTKLLVTEKPTLINNLDNKFETRLFLPEGENRQGEGGLRTKGDFKKTSEDKPLISIITVVYNGEKYLEETIQSVLNQTYDNVEYIIIDGGSTDRTLDIIRKYEDAIDYWVSEKDSGIYNAWNKGVIASTGDWIGFLGADDILQEEAFDKFISKIKISLSSTQYISSQIQLCDEQKKPLNLFGEEWEWSKFSKYMNVAHVGSLHHRSLFQKFGLYDESFKIAGDYELLLRAGKTLRAVYIDDVTCTMRTGGVSNTNVKVFFETFYAQYKHKTRSFLPIVFIRTCLIATKYQVKKMLSKRFVV